MRVLVTGHLGYIGSVLVPIFQDAGHEVVGLDTDLYRGCTFGDPSLVPTVSRVDADLRDVRVEQLDGIDAIVHLGALSNDPLGDLDSELTFDIHHLASVRLATIGREAGVLEDRDQDRPDVPEMAGDENPHARCLRGLVD